ncbi:MAG TPA: 23S rRNA (adenine(2503)-C(2))-methyltransferase RlmN [Verrucomicrobiae bacterium]|nr:23S rRNA (adenine(2503)-C(2))-methyltransferase RlmN [Verrucomicrobiae bacterium]
MAVLTDIKSLTREELEAQFAAWEQPVYRVKQLMDWLYVQRVTDWDAMSNLPKALREKLRREYALGTLELIRKQGSRDTTQKFLWRLADHSLIESVLIPANPSLYGEPSDRHTLCVSTQVGCAYGCKFCASGLDGWKRNLLPHEIIEQVMGVERFCATENRVSDSAAPMPPPRNPGNAFPNERVVDNVVIMGMGEPMANYDNLLKALRLLNSPWGGRIGARKITVSTSGLAPQIRKLADEPEQFSLAISLHGATDEVREKIMPVNRKYPLKELTAALVYYQSKRGRMITFEYILIAGVNDGVEQTRPLAALAKRLNAKVNLIPYNKVEDLPWVRPEEDVCEKFLAALKEHKVVATLRREKGHDIDAACGQLRLKTERELLDRSH